MFFFVLFCFVLFCFVCFVFFFFFCLVNSSLLTVSSGSKFGPHLGGVWDSLWSGNWVVFGSAFRWRLGWSLGCVWVVE